MRRIKSLLVICLVLAASLSLCFSGCGRTPEPAPPADTSVSSAEDDTPVTSGKIWAFLDGDVADFAANYNVNDVKSLRLDIPGESGSIYSTTDPGIIDQVFRAMDKITVMEESADTVPNADQIFTFIKTDGSEYSIVFNDNNLTAKGINFLLTGDEDLWDAVINLKENATESYTSDKDDPDDVEPSGDEDPDDPENAKKKSGNASHFSYEKESTGDGTEIIFGDALVITLPPDWNGKYVMEPNGDHVTFYHKASREGWQQYDGSDGGVLFGLSYYTTKEERENSEYIGPARDGGYYYINFVSDMQAYMEDEDVVEEYGSLLEEVDAIANDAFSSISQE